MKGEVKERVNDSILNNHTFIVAAFILSLCRCLAPFFAS